MPAKALEKVSNRASARVAAARFGIALLVLLAGLSVRAVSLAGEPKLTPIQLFQRRNLCSNAAEAAFRSQWSHPADGITLLGYTNRYDVKLDRCYLLVTYRKGKSTWFDVSDARTGRRQAHIIVASP